MKSLFNQFLNALIFLICFILLFICFFLFKDLLGFDFRQMDTEVHEISERKNHLKTKMFKDVERIENGIHMKTGLAWDKNFDVVRANCTSCHSAKLITQNRATKEGWEEMIEWMQKTQGLQDLGDNHEVIVSYLSEHYAPKQKGRRQAINPDLIDWYELD